MSQNSGWNVLKIATVDPINDEEFIDHVEQNPDGTLITAHDLPIIRALANGLGGLFEVVKPEDNAIGFKEIDGNWSGIIGMLRRGEADLSGFPITLYQDKREAVYFTFPMQVSDVTFMTDKPEPYPKNFAIFEVFSFEVWIAIGLCLLFISLFLYFLLKRKESFSIILVESTGCLFEQSYSVQVRQRNTALLLLHWFFATTVLTTSYKTVILSVLTFPRLVGIRDIKDLSKAAEKKSVMCMTYVSCATDVWFDSNDERFRYIGECLKRGERESLFFRDFFKYPYKKVFIATRNDINKFNREYFISSDSFSVSHHSILYSKKFCCPKKLENVVHHIVAADLYPKLMRDRDFTAQLLLTKPKNDDYDGIHLKPLSLTDLSGAFFVLIIGQCVSILVLIAEIISKKLFI